MVKSEENKRFLKSVGSIRLDNFLCMRVTLRGGQSSSELAPDLSERFYLDSQLQFGVPLQGLALQTLGS